MCGGGTYVHVMCEEAEMSCHISLQMIRVTWSLANKYSHTPGMEEAHLDQRALTALVRSACLGIVILVVSPGLPVLLL